MLHTHTNNLVEAEKFIHHNGANKVDFFSLSREMRELISLRSIRREIEHNMPISIFIITTLDDFFFSFSLSLTYSATGISFDTHLFLFIHPKLFE
jgi:hypothetical protein